MSHFQKTFAAARQISTPLVVVRTPDAASTINNVRKAVTIGMSPTDAETFLSKTPTVVWDAIHGLFGLNQPGGSEVANMASRAQVDVQASASLPMALLMAEKASSDVILFIHNLHLFWSADNPLVIQGLWNLRDKYKANGNMVVGLVALGAVVPSELNNDMLLLEEPLPTREEIKRIIKQTYVSAGVKASLLPSDETLTKAADALVGIAYFPADQSAAMALDMTTGALDIAALWQRKKDIISATNGLSFPDLTGYNLAAAGGVDNFKNYLTMYMEGKRRAQIILRLDEIEKMFAGAHTDTSGVKGDLLGNFLSWVEDKKILCFLLIGVPGAAKSHIIYCLGGEFGVPVLNFDISGMQDSLVGNSGKNLRTAEATVEAISDGQIVLIATANSQNGLPPELLSRFEKGGIFFFDAPDATERQEILKIKIKQYGLTAKQVAEVPDMTGWTGREIDSMCQKADDLGITLKVAGQYVVPLTKSHSETITKLRQSAHNRFLSASKPGLYTFEEKEHASAAAAGETMHLPVVETVTGRKMR